MIERRPLGVRTDSHYELGRRIPRGWFTRGLRRVRSGNLEDREPLSDKRKARVLLKYDPFKSAWLLSRSASDYVNADAEFTTQNVPNAVASLKPLGGSE